MANCLRAARTHGIRVVVCDRPNPINGDDIEGATLDPAYASFVGQFPIPMRHGLTIGEAARLFNDHFGLNAAVDVVPMDGWTRVDVLRRDRAAVGAAVAQHPDARHARSSTRAAVLFEGTLLSEGRGTTRPFEFIGAPWIDGERFADAMNRAEAAGRVLPAGLLRADVPQARAERCGGCQIHVTDRAAYRSMRVAVEMLEEFRSEAPARAALARSAVRVRTREAADRHPLRIGSAAARHRRRRSRRVDHGGLADATKPRSGAAREVPAVLAPVTVAGRSGAMSRVLLIHQVLSVSSCERRRARRGSDPRGDARAGRRCAARCRARSGRPRCACPRAASRPRSGSPSARRSTARAARKSSSDASCGRS